MARIWHTDEPKNSAEAGCLFGRQSPQTRAGRPPMTLSRGALARCVGGPKVASARDGLGASASPLARPQVARPASRSLRVGRRVWRLQPATCCQADSLTARKSLEQSPRVEAAGGAPRRRSGSAALPASAANQIAEQPFACKSNSERCTGSSGLGGWSRCNSRLIGSVHSRRDSRFRRAAESRTLSSSARQVAGRGADCVRFCSGLSECINAARVSIAAGISAGNQDAPNPIRRRLLAASVGRPGAPR